ncbi:hypothetical protein BRD14_04840 [Halobacteriales archaeon SW_5_68_122]|nr:MAG: hypothetical protein BRD14_04840 [Halobacteriales archaeon SW_5_68_122]
MTSGPGQLENAREATATGGGLSEEIRESFLEGLNRVRMRSLGSTKAPERFAPVGDGACPDAPQGDGSNDGAGSDGR